MILSTFLIFIGAILVAILHGRIGTMPVINFPLGKGWISLTDEMFIPIPVDFGLGIALLAIPYARWFGLGALLYGFCSFAAMIGQRVRKGRERSRESQRKKSHEEFIQRLHDILAKA
jgi:hypothetical protein